MATRYKRTWLETTEHTFAVSVPLDVMENERNCIANPRDVFEVNSHIIACEKTGLPIFGTFRVTFAEDDSVSLVGPLKAPDGYHL